MNIFLVSDPTNERIVVETGWCPSSVACLPEPWTRINSSSDQNVPSNKRTLHVLNCCSQSGRTRAAPGKKPTLYPLCSRKKPTTASGGGNCEIRSGLRKPG